MFREADSLDVSLALFGVQGQTLHEPRGSIRVRGIFKGGYQLVEVVSIGGGEDDL